ncbi:DinB family protein [Prosthecochloris sp. GSB1]|uniref:DinB family protein n=1 Tax=Prosthecochloris sp. GSB1 TaxID=281093 RepID=UPI001237810D|nr:DinB family protein [Prosthecochloris sp. GSB1]
MRKPYGMGADALVFSAIRGRGEAERDGKILDLVQKAFLSVLQGETFASNEARPLDMAALANYARNVLRDAARYHEGLDSAMLERIIELPWQGQIGEKLGFEIRSPRLGEVLVQVLVHTAYHRGQVNMRLREIGIDPSMTDYMAWVWAGKPSAAWFSE